jgi:hypothetical protein
MGGVAAVCGCRYTEWAIMELDDYSETRAAQDVVILPRWGAAMLRPYKGINVATL